MEPGAGTDLIEAVAERIVELGLVAQTTVGVHQTIVAALGDTAGRDELDAELAELPGVERVVRISRPYKLSSIEATMHEPTTLTIAGREVGPATFCMIAGPVHRRVARADVRDRRERRRRGRVDAARRGVQAAHLAVRLPGSRRRGARDPRRGPRR